MPKKIRNILSVLLIAIGLLQIVGFISQLSWLKGVGQLTVASPLPIVFTQQKGIETFASNFYIEYEEKPESKKRIQITPALYHKFKAPYNYRNVLGATISYGPILPKNMVNSVLNFCFQSPGEISKALGLIPPLKNARIIIETRTFGRNDVWELKIEQDKNE